MNDYAEVYQPADQMSDKEMRRVERYLDAVRSTLLFAKGVLLVEGDAELILIPAMLKAVLGTTPDELGFSLISMSSAFFDHVSSLFSDNRLQRPCAILTDGDAPFVDLPIDPSTDDKEQAHARHAQQSGIQRRQALEVSTNGNPWVEPFFAECTFEVDFIHAANAAEVIRTLDEIYIDAAAVARSRDALNSAEDGIAATEILRLAARQGKGWFAVLLAEQLDFETRIPSYILEAVAFACHKCVQTRASQRMAEFRVQKIMESNSPLRAKLAPLNGIEAMTPQVYVDSFGLALPNDEFTEFYGYLKAYQGT